MRRHADRADSIAIARLIDLEASGVGPDALVDAIVRIFRATAARWPAEPAAARSFQHLWLDQYLQHERDLALLAFRPAGVPHEVEVVGYVVGCRIDPATSPRFAALIPEGRTRK